MTEKIKDGYYKIKPAGRHIITIGRDLIKDKYAAIVELVKNSYDADAQNCTISLSPIEIENQPSVKVTIKDDGHGMSFDTVVNKWMVPSTDDKVHRITSPSGRMMQGRKGIGRYSASIIGDDLVLQTVSVNKELTTLYLIWKNFENAQYLEDVDILVENFTTALKAGTEIIIVGDASHLEEWTEKQIQNLKFELKKLIPPNDFTSSNSEIDTENFNIFLELGDFGYGPGLSNLKEKVEPYPVFDLFDYRIAGTVDKNGLASLTYENKRLSNSKPERLEDFTIMLDQNKDESYCGNVDVDFRVFDRDKESIDALIERGLKDPHSGQYVGRRAARIILDTYNGVGVYRNGFRIRPLGDAGYDWLELDKQRVQNPSLKVGSDQIIGFIHVQREVLSGLEEKSARDGLKENSQYWGLQTIAKQVLSKLEVRRYAFRQSVGSAKSQRQLEFKITNLYNFADLIAKINKELDLLNISSEKKEKINKIISEKEEDNNKIANELKDAIALYQGQATIGKIVNVILHEGRKPLSYFKNQIPNIVDWADDLSKNYSDALMQKVLNRLQSVEKQSDILIRLFNQLDPLSAKKRGRKRDFNLFKVIEDVYGVFESVLLRDQISYSVDCDINQTCFGWEEDFYITFTNLVDNSIFWLQRSLRDEKQISFKAYEEGESLLIEYRDNGPGIEKALIESEVIFEPEFSGKTEGGSGLGLAIAGEAIERNEGTLKAVYSATGAFFKIELNNQ